MTDLWTDERGIEGLPVRLVVAVAVGVTALGVMMGMLAEFDDVGTTELTLEVSDELVVLGETDTVTLTVVTEEGQPVENAHLLVTGGSLPLANGPVDLQTGDTAAVTLGIDTAGADATARTDFRDGQTRGTLDIEVIPPSGGDLVDERGNPEVVVVRG